MIYAILASALLVILCAWLWVLARDAEQSAEYWRVEARYWRSMSRVHKQQLNEALEKRDKAFNFARSAIDSMAGRQEEIDQRDAEIERLLRPTGNPWVREIHRTIRRAQQMQGRGVGWRWGMN